MECPGSKDLPQPLSRHRWPLAPRHTLASFPPHSNDRAEQDWDFFDHPPTASRPKTPPEGGGIGARIKEANRENANETMNSSSVATMLPILRTGASRHIMVGFGPAACYPESH